MSALKNYNQSLEKIDVVIKHNEATFPVILNVSLFPSLPWKVILYLYVSFCSLENARLASCLGTFTKKEELVRISTVNMISMMKNPLSGSLNIIFIYNYYGISRLRTNEVGKVKAE